MFCSQCGTRLSEGSEFCHSCGFNVAQTAQESREESRTDSPRDVEAGAPPTFKVPQRSETPAESEVVAPTANVPANKPAPEHGPKGRAAQIQPESVPLWATSHSWTPSKVAVLPRGTQVSVLEQASDGMIRVATEDGLEGWLHETDIGEGQRPAAQIQPESVPLWATSHSWTPSKVAVLPRGTQMSVLERASDGMVRVATEDGLEGWLHETDIGEGQRPADESATPAVATEQRFAPPRGSHTQVRTAAPPSSGNEVGVLGRLLFLLGGGGITASPFLPWISASFIFTVNVSLYDIGNMNDDWGPFAEVLTIGIAGVVGGLLRVTRAINLGAARVWAIIVGGAGLVEVFYRYNQFNSSFGSEIASLQFGFYLLAIASVAVLVSVLVDREEVSG